MPGISLVVPVYNKEEYLDQFLQSLDRQSFADYEVVFVDDGSRDGSPTILDNYAKEHPKARVIHKENGGVSSARNMALDVIRGEYVYIADSDDWLADDALAVLWEEAKRTDADVIYGETVTVSGTKTAVHRPFPHAFFSNDRSAVNEIQCALNNNNRIHADCRAFSTINYLGGAPWHGMLRRSIIERHGIRYNEKLRTLGEDILFWQNVYEHVESVAYVESVIYYYRSADNSLSHGYKRDLLEIYRGVFQEEEAFLREKGKGREHWEAYYFRVILYIRQSIGFYFRNADNPKTEAERFREFRETLSSEPYRSAVRKVRLGKLVDNKRKMKILLLRMGLLKLYWKYA